MSGRGCVDFVKEVLMSGGDILVVGRVITASKDFGHADDEFIEQLNKKETDQLWIMTHF